LRVHISWTGLLSCEEAIGPFLPAFTDITRIADNFSHLKAYLASVDSIRKAEDAWYEYYTTLIL